jgi:hypothetical protein
MPALSGSDISAFVRGRLAGNKILSQFTFYVLACEPAVTKALCATQRSFRFRIHTLLSQRLLNY